FVERAAKKTRHPVLLSLWRDWLLLGIGLLHALLWEGDILVVYALCAPFVLALRKRRPQTLLAVGVFLVLVGSTIAIAVQQSLPPNGQGLGRYWFVEATAMSTAVETYLTVDVFSRSLGMMLIGVALYRLGIVQGTRSPSYYRAMSRLGLGVGLPIAAGGALFQAMQGYSSDIALVGQIPITVATIPIALGYFGLITLWNQRPATPFNIRVRDVGRMALTNYLMQTVLGIIILRGLLERGDLTRTGIALFVVVVWVAQLSWSKAWLARFWFGPVEWLWRVATYRRYQPLRRT
ncbi:MAG: DUF418 domain-containing protein, partial [Actinomycetota bacterium]|nr:DUF418 domain-containing protein [Actinomycetota bacterium]